MEMVKFFQKKDFISYKIEKIKNKIAFESLLKINENPFLIKLLNYEKMMQKKQSLEFVVIKIKRIDIYKISIISRRKK